MTALYIVWNEARTEGYATRDAGVAYEARKGADTNCYTRDGTPAPFAVDFCNRFTFDNCTTQTLPASPAMFQQMRGYHWNRAKVLQDIAIKRAASNDRNKALFGQMWIDETLDGAWWHARCVVELNTLIGNTPS